MVTISEISVNIKARHAGHVAYFKVFPSLSMEGFIAVEQETKTGGMGKTELEAVETAWKRAKPGLF